MKNLQRRITEFLAVEGREMEEKKKNNKKRTVNPDGACPYARKCGGCDYQGTAYEKQLKEKQELAQKYVGGFCKVRPIIGM